MTEAVESLFYETGYCMGNQILVANRDKIRQPFVGVRRNAALKSQVSSSHCATLYCCERCWSFGELPADSQHSLQTDLLLVAFHHPLVHGGSTGRHVAS